MSQENLHDKINRETAKIHWNELTTFFAAGHLISIDHTLDLIDAALAMTNDDTPTIEQWMQKGHLHKATDKQASQWQAHNTEFWAVVIKPWVLIQEIK